MGAKPGAPAWTDWTDGTDGRAATLGCGKSQPARRANAPAPAATPRLTSPVVHDFSDMTPSFERIAGTRLGPQVRGTGLAGRAARRIPPGDALSHVGQITAQAKNFKGFWGRE